MARKREPTKRQNTGVDLSKYRNVDPPKPNLPERTGPLKTARELSKMGKSDEEIISVLTHPGMGYGLFERKAGEILYAVKEGYPGNDMTYYWLWSLAESKDVFGRKYMDRELYEGYYWLVLHTHPRPGGSEIHPYYPVPNCVITAIKEHPHWQALLGDYKYKTNLPDYLFGWFVGQDIPFLKVDGVGIKCWRDIEKLWERLNLYKICHDLDKLFHELKFYFEPQHQENLKSLTSGPKMSKQKPAQFSLEDRYLAYHWLIIHTNPHKEELHLGNLTPPPCISEMVNELKETGVYLGSKGEMRGTDPFLSSASIDLILSNLIQRDIPLLYIKDDRGITCVGDIRRLWQDAGLQTSEDLDYKEYYRIKAYLASRHTENLMKLETPALGGQKTTLTTKEVIEILEQETKIKSISDSYFNKIRTETDGFPEPINPGKAPHLYRREDLPKMVHLTNKYSDDHTKKIPIRKSTKTKRRKKKTSH